MYVKVHDPAGVLYDEYFRSPIAALRRTTQLPWAYRPVVHVFNQHGHRIHTATHRPENRR